MNGRPLSPRDNDPGTPAVSPDAGAGAHKVTVVLPVKNVAGIIKECMDSLAWADEILIADGQSTDGTLEILARYPRARVVQHPSKDIRIIVQDTEKLASHPWVFWFCADEVCTPELGDEIRKRVRNAPADVSFFMVPTKFKMFGTDFGDGQAFPRLWRKGTATFALKEMHEMPSFVGRSEDLTHPYWHLCSPNIRTIIPKYLRYEYVDAQHATDAECERVNPSFFFQLLRFNYYAVKTYWPNRKRGVAATLMGLTTGMGQLIRHLLLVEEVRVRRGEIDRDTHGWGS